ncbi:MAG: TolC family protein [Chitinispirillaceae bacterium]|nr:TolC family protein [Chitinispirillaceae bacterium]
MENGMRINRYTYFLCLLFLTTGAAGAKVFTLDELLEKGLKSSKSLQKIHKEMEIAEVTIQELFGSAIPRVTASFEIGHAFSQSIPYLLVNDESVVERSGTASIDRAAAGWVPIQTVQQDPPLVEQAISLPRNNLIGAISLQQPLFSQGKTLINLRIARARQSQLVCRYDEERDRVRCETIKMFYRVLLEQQRLEISKERLALAEESHRLTKVNFSFGHARELDTLNSLLQLELTRIGCTEAESRRRGACEAIIGQCGLARSPEAFWVEGAFPEPVFFLSLDEAIVQMHRGNHRIKQFRGDETIQKNMINMAKADLLPTLYGGGTVGRIGQFSDLTAANSVRWGDDHRLFVGLSWTLFSGLTRTNTIRRQIFERDLLSLDQQKTVEELEAATRDAFDQVTVAMERLTAIRTIIGIAEKSYAIARKAFEIGSGTLFDLQNAELEFNRARLSLNEALYEFHRLLTDFKFLIGRL